jgi:hypothetical protein
VTYGSSSGFTNNILTGLFSWGLIIMALIFSQFQYYQYLLPAIIALVLICMGAIFRESRFHVVVTALGSALFSAVVVLFTISFQAAEQEVREDIVSIDRARSAITLNSIRTNDWAFELNRIKSVYPEIQQLCKQNHAYVFDLQNGILNLLPSVYSSAPNFSAFFENNNHIIFKKVPATALLMQEAADAVIGITSESRNFYEHIMLPHFDWSNPNKLAYKEQKDFLCSSGELIYNNAVSSHELLRVFTALGCLFYHNSTLDETELLQQANSTVVKSSLDSAKETLAIVKNMNAECVADSGTNNLIMAPNKKHAP